MRKSKLWKKPFARLEDSPSGRILVGYVKIACAENHGNLRFGKNLIRYVPLQSITGESSHGALQDARRQAAEITPIDRCLRPTEKALTLIDSQIVRRMQPITQAIRDIVASLPLPDDIDFQEQYAPRGGRVAAVRRPLHLKRKFTESHNARTESHYGE